MSQEKVEVVRRMYEEARDRTTDAALASSTAAEV